MVSKWAHNQSLCPQLMMLQGSFAGTMVLPRPRITIFSQYQYREVPGTFWYATPQVPRFYHMVLAHNNQVAMHYTPFE